MARMTKDKQERLKEHARLLYVSEGIQTQRELAERVGVGERTIGKWIEDENWKRLKQNVVLTRQEQYAYLMNELEQLNAFVKNSALGFADSKVADTRRKLIRDIKDLEAESLGLAEIISVQVEFLTFVRQHDAKQGLAVAELSDLFIKSKL
ncbi:MAG: transcriptional regulator [Capnocytophaga sp.]|nr:transcriptional regulator [Capnocytophaga sp.]